MEDEVKAIGGLGLEAIEERRNRFKALKPSDFYRNNDNENVVHEYWSHRDNDLDDLIAEVKRLRRG